ncbi:MAG: response regulator [Bacteroidia bacterium]
MNFKTIAILDDNPTTIFYNLDVVSDLYPESKILTFEDPRQFIDTYIKTLHATNEPLLLLLDISMPDCLGYEVLDELEDEFEVLENLFVIMVTSSNQKADVEKSSRYSCIRGYIEKPLTEEKLKPIVD